MTVTTVGVDVGGTSTKACVVAGDTILASVVIPTHLDGDGSLGSLATAAVKAAVAESGHDIARLDGIGIGIPGQVVAGVVRNAANLGIGEDGFDLAGHVRTATGLATVVDNDTTVAAMGAITQLRRSEPSIRDLVYIALGTGVSAGLVLDGQAHRGAHGLAGEFGHVPMGTGLECRCGAIGCLETVIGAGALADAWKGEGDVFKAAGAGDERAHRLVATGLDHLAHAMWWLAAAYDPDIFVIGGGISANNPDIGGQIATRWRSMAASSPLARRVLDPDRIRMSDLEEPVGAFGAALLAVGDRADQERKSRQR